MDYGKIAAYTDIALQSNPNATAKQSLTGIQKEIPVVQTELTSLTDKVQEQKEKIVVQDSKLQDYKYQYIGDRTWFWARWIIGTWAALSILGSLLVSLTGGTGILGVIGKNIVWAMPFVNPFRWITAILSSFLGKS